jgi:dienelactone hydrolase
LQFCWGGKVVSLISGPDTLFKATAQAHPGMLDVADAPKITIPTCLLASKEEAAELVEDWGRALTVDKDIRRFEEQVHGWMSAKGNLEDEKCRKEYENGYRIFLEWFAKYL